MVIDMLQDKIYKIRYIHHKDSILSELERKLRIKLIENENELLFHEKMLPQSFDGMDYSETPSEESIYEYVSLFNYKKRVESIIENI